MQRNKKKVDILLEIKLAPRNLVWLISRKRSNNNITPLALQFSERMKEKKDIYYEFCCELTGFLKMTTQGLHVFMCDLHVHMCMCEWNIYIYIYMDSFINIKCANWRQSLDADDRSFFWGVYSLKLSVPLEFFCFFIPYPPRWEQLCSTTSSTMVFLLTIAETTVPSPMVKTLKMWAKLNIFFNLLF